MALLRDDDIAKLLLRVTVGGMMIFHGIHKIIHGVGGIKNLLASHGLPEFFAYGVYVGEVIAPLMILMGYFSRLGALLVAFTMLNAIYLAHGGAIFSLGKHGALAIELPLMFLILSIAIFLSGPGKYAVNNK
jgi:putative oxidoreductase